MLAPGKRTLVESLGEVPQIRRKAAELAKPPEPPAEPSAEPAESTEGTGAPDAEPGGEPTSKDVEEAEANLIGDVGTDEAEAPGGRAEAPGGRSAAPGNGAAEPEPNALAAALSGGGRPLPEELRTSLEATAGRDLSGVRVHDDPAAGQAAQAVGAGAFTLKQDIYFAPGAYDPSSAEGRRLIAHEVAHTLQPEGPMGAGVTAPDDTVEREAEAFADAADQRPEAPADAAGAPAAPAATPEGAVAPDLATAPDATAAGAAPAAALAAAPAPARGPAAVRTRVPRFPGVVKEAFDADKVRWIDETDHRQGKVWQEDRGYIKNPTATKLSTVVGANGKVGGGFDNGRFMYVVDAKGEVWVGKRSGKIMPHPTLIGGKDPQVLGAGMVDIRRGKIVNIDNHSGHFHPPRSSLRAAVKGFLKLPKEVFKKDFRAESVHFDAAGNVTRQEFKSLRMLKLKSFSPTRTINRLMIRYEKDPKFKGKVNAGLKGAGKAGLAIIAALVLDHFLRKWLAEIEAEQIRKALEKLAPEVEAALLESLDAQADALDALHESNPDAKVFLNIVYRLAWIESYMAGRGGQVTSAESFGGVDLLSAELSQTAIQEDLKFESVNACFGSTTKYRRLSMSEEIRVGDLYGDESDKPEEPEPDRKKVPGDKK